MTLYYPFLAGHGLNTEKELILQIEPANTKMQVDSIILTPHDTSSRFPHHKKIEHLKPLQIKKIKGGELIRKKGGVERIQLAKGKTEIQFIREPKQTHPISLEVTPPSGAKPGQIFLYYIKQLNQAKQLVGGITVVFQKEVKVKKTIAAQKK
jgi:hypothetical protein